MSKTKAEFLANLLGSMSLGISPQVQIIQPVVQVIKPPVMKVNCMMEDLVHMTATVPVADVQMDLSKMQDSWTLDAKKKVYTKSWAADQFDESEMSVDTDDNLVLTKKISSDCKKQEVDDVFICTETGHTLDFVCKYRLGTRTVKNTFDVSGHDAQASAEGVGELKYELKVVDDDVDIGNKVSVTVTPLNKGLVYAQLNDCTVTYNEQSVSIIDFEAGSAGNAEWIREEDALLQGLTVHGNLKFNTYEEAEFACKELPFPECGGVTFFQLDQQYYQPRQGNTFIESPDLQISWKRVNGSPAKRASLSPVCDIDAVIDTAYSKSHLTFNWSAFKWATAKKGARELQTITCDISLSKDKPEVNVGDCDDGR